MSPEFVSQPVAHLGANPLDVGVLSVSNAASYLAIHLYREVGPRRHLKGHGEEAPCVLNSVRMWEPVPKTKPDAAIVGLPGKGLRVLLSPVPHHRQSCAEFHSPLPFVTIPPVATDHHQSEGKLLDRRAGISLGKSIWLAF